MSEGWIKLYRQIEDNPLYFSEPFTRCGAWIDLLLLANHSDNIFYNRSIKVYVKRGQIGWSLENLAKRWKWSRGKAERFICELEKANQIVRQKNNITTLITIVKYEYYQYDSKANGKPSSKPSSKADGQQIAKQTDTNKNEEKDKNEKNEDNDKNKDFDLNVVARNEKKKLRLNSLLEHDYFKNEEFSDLWQTYNEQRKKKPTIDSKIIGLKELFDFTLEESKQALKDSIKSGWDGIFPKKANGSSINGGRMTHNEALRIAGERLKEEERLARLRPASLENHNITGELVNDF